MTREREIEQLKLKLDKVAAHRPLTKLEMAAITAQVPCCEDSEVNKIISLSLRLKVATEMGAAILARTDRLTCNDVADLALQHADALLARFQGRKL